MVFKQPQTRAEAISRAQQRDALVGAARVLDDCKVEPDTSGKLKRIAEQMDAAIQAAALSRDVSPAEAVFLASLPTGSSGQPLPGHTRWDDLGPKAKERYLRMAQAAKITTTDTP